MSTVFMLSVKTKAMEKIVEQKSYNVRRIFICLGKISRLYHESLHGNCLATINLFDQLRKLNQIDVLLTSQLKHLEKKIQTKKPNCANKLLVNKERVHLRLTVTNSIGFMFAEILEKLERVLALFEIAQVVRVYKSRRAITNKYNLCLNAIMQFIGQLSNLPTKEGVDSYLSKTLSKQEKGLLRLALNHSAMPDYIEKARAYYQMKLKETAVAAKEELATTI
ncbi:hypothetical protein [Cysteiniphilum litorale]|uniref:hypothetical protein n=1 Tax=Cysteiniphilum litorale TaxID=2056700 RepID=UPI003F880EFE